MQNLKKCKLLNILFQNDTIYKGRLQVDNFPIFHLSESLSQKPPLSLSLSLRDISAETETATLPPANFNESCPLIPRLGKSDREKEVILKRKLREKEN